MNFGRVKPKRKGIVFSIAFFLLFAILLSSVILASSSMRDIQSARASASRTLREGALSENIGKNLADFMNLSISGSRNPDGNLTVNISTSLYSIDSDISKYSSFFSGNFLPKTNINATLDLSEFSSSPKAVSRAANYSFSSLSKGASNYSFSSGISSGRIHARFSDGAEFDDSGWSWQSCSAVCPVGEFFLELDIRNSTGSQILPGGCSSGCLLNSATNVLRLNSSSPETASINVSSRFFSVSAKGSAGLTLVQSARIPTNLPAEFAFPGRLNISGFRSNFTEIPITKI